MPKSSVPTTNQAGEVRGWKCNNCQTVFTSEQQERKPNDNNGGPVCPGCKAHGQYTYPYALHKGDPCERCSVAHDDVEPGPCVPAPTIQPATSQEGNRPEFPGSSIASVERVAQHRNGPGAEPYLSIFFTVHGPVALHALLYATPGHAAIFRLDDPAVRLNADIYEHDLRAIAADVGLPYDNADPLDALHDRATAVLALVRKRRAETPPGPDRAKMRGIGRHLDRAVHSVKSAMERAAQ